MDVPVPRIDEDEVLVRVAAVGVGLHDRWFLPPDPVHPYAIGIEGAGTVEQVGRGVHGLEPGQRVMFLSSLQPKGGTWAELAAVRADALTAVPDGLSLVDAAALPVAGHAALESLAALAAGDEVGSVFVSGASGAIGTLAVQLAVARGYRVGGSASRANHPLLLDLGVELAVDYGDDDWVEQVRCWAPGGVDAALAVPLGAGPAALPVVRDGGRLVTVSGDEVAAERGVTVVQIAHRPETQGELAVLAADVAAGRVRVVIEQVYPFEEAVAALEKTETRHARGKSVLVL